jgi:hypothetical protein
MGFDISIIVHGGSHLYWFYGILFLYQRQHFLNSGIIGRR